MRFEQYPGVVRSLSIIQLNKFELKALHISELQSPCLFTNSMIRERFYTKKIGVLTDEEVEYIAKIIEEHRPKSKDGTDEEEMDLFSMEYQHAWDFNIFYKCDKKDFKVGGLKRKAQKLIDEIEGKEAKTNE